MKDQISNFSVHLAYYWANIHWWTFSKWLVVWWGGKNAFVLSNYQLKLLPHPAVQRATLRDETIEILQYTLPAITSVATWHISSMTFRIYTKKRGELSLENKKKEQDHSRTKKVQNLMWCHISWSEIYAVLSRVQSFSIEMWKKSISNSSVD